MDPLQAIAARQVSPACKSEAEEIDVFYETHAFARLHGARRAFMQLVRLLRETLGRIRRSAATAAEIASAADRA